MSVHHGPRFPIRLRGQPLTGRARPILRTGAGRSRPSRSDGAQGPGSTTSHHHLIGAMAQLVAHLLCKQGVTGSSPVGSTAFSLSSSTPSPGLPLPPSPGPICAVRAGTGPVRPWSCLSHRPSARPGRAVTLWDPARCSLRASPPPPGESRRPPFTHRLIVCLAPPLGESIQWCHLGSHCARWAGAD